MEEGKTGALTHSRSSECGNKHTDLRLLLLLLAVIVTAMVMVISRN